MNIRAVIGPLSVTLALALSGCVADAGYDSDEGDEQESGDVALELTAAQGPQGGVNEQGEGEAGPLKGEAPAQSGQTRQAGTGPEDLFVALEPDPDPWTPGHEGNGDSP